MPVDFTQLYSSSSGNPSARGALRPGINLSALASLPLKTGEMATAEVVRLQNIKPEHQAQLLKQGRIEPPPTAASNTGKESASPAPVRLASLLVKGQIVQTLTRALLTPGDKLAVAVQPGRGLVIQPPGTNSVMAGKGTSAALQQALVSTDVATANTNRPPIAPQELATALREILPRQNGPTLEPAIALLQRLLQQLPNQSGLKNIQQLLQKLESQALTPNTPQMLTAPAAKEAVQNTGTLLEARLLNALRSNPAALEPVLQNDRKAILLKLAQAVVSQLTPSAVSEPAQRAITPQKPADLPLLAQLLGTGGHKAQAQQNRLTLELMEALPGGKNALLQDLLNASPRPATAEQSQTLRTQLLLLTHQLTLTSLARIRQQQLQPEISRARQGEAPAGINIHLDVPIRVDQQLYNARLGIEEFPDPESDRATTKQAKCWQVTLDLDTPAGPLAARLRYLNASVDVVIWSEDKTLLTEAKTRFNEYRAPFAAAGIELNKVQFREGAPPEQGNKLRYNLVDITT
ncbi:flagellar hook-length control protein FliK [Gilvimarinus xylanilyticus]|uniref:Flagellar hook-length control protein FliK n=1 Tax=Gilvimarinus xylanilyticus TaxID=2944139 RepID=A0A9X2I0K8_9GAMM|nr:flagellar hook-length control protein FliK [Gilvimarinus xylanilyticus]MCP8898418.1 flagellar hook-length control protein FliK [Gilvimarinus xylanilyticus]